MRGNISVRNQQLVFDALTERELEILTQMAEGLSNHEIAHKLSLAYGTVKWYSAQIYSKLGVNNRTQAVAHLDSLRQQDSPRASADSTLNLPMPLTSFVGRQREINDIKHLLAANRLVTLTGPGGSGKTRLALEVASGIQHAFADSITFVDLASVANPTLVASTMAHALRIAEHPDTSLIQTLKYALHNRELLILIDNFEHVIDAAPLLSDLLIAAPKLSLLVTSREALRLNGEQEYPVPPMALPTCESASSQSLTETEATALFLQRAQLAYPNFEITEENAPAVAEICLRLDGLPLTIELAAARCKLLSPHTLLERLDNRLTVIRGGARDLPERHQTLRHTIDWSYDLLDESEQLLFNRLAVFRGGRSLEAIEAICVEGLPGDVFDALTGLLDKSLIYRKDARNDDPRLWMLETIHEYAWEKLEGSGEAETIRRRHAEYFVALAVCADPELQLAQHLYWSQRLEAEHDNLRAVLEWSLQGGDVTCGVRLAGALNLFWYAYGHHAEGLHWTGQLLERLDEVPEIYHAKFLHCAGKMIHFRDLETARQLFEDALGISRKLGDKYQAALALIEVGYTSLKDTHKGLATAGEGLRIYRELDHQPGIAHALNIIGEIARYGGDDEYARQVYEECLSIVEQTGETRRICFMLENLAFIAQHENDHHRAIDLLQQALKLSGRVNSQVDIACNLTAMAGSLASIGQPQRGARLLGVVDSIYERLGAFVQPADQPEFDQKIATLRAKIDDEDFKIAHAEGQKMSLKQAVAEALGEMIDTSSPDT